MFAFICLLTDRVIGVISDYLVEHAKNSETAKLYNICERCTDNLLIFGTSRGIFHYDTKIFEDSLKISCYNCGLSGYGSVFFNGLYKIICQRYTPKYIIYDVAPFADYLVKKEDNSKFLGPLKRYRDYPGIGDILEFVADPSEIIKTYSYMYRYNSKFCMMIIDNLKSDSDYDKGYKGFVPKEGIIENDVKWTKDSEDKTFEHYFDPVRKKLFDDFVEDCINNGTKLLFCVSPWYKRKTDESFDYAKLVAHKYGIPFINHYNDTMLNTHREYFYDPLHLNKKGAEQYSRIIAHEIKKYINE